MTKLKTKTQVILNKARSGQALVEYVLIIVLVAIAFAFALAATGPAIGNVFSNTVYNLLGQTPIDDIRDVGGPVDFWLTVTWVDENPLQEQPLPTRTQAPPSATPTPGSPPPPTPVTPSRTPYPTSTPAPTPTPGDKAFDAPYLDTVDTPENWRLGSEPFLGYDEWCGTYFANPSSEDHQNQGALDYLGATAAFTRCNSDYNKPDTILNYDSNGWPSNSSGDWPAANPNDHFSVRFTRQIVVQDSAKTLQFAASSDDGIRVWILAAGQTAGDKNTAGCSSTGRVSGQPYSGANNFYGDPSTDCLLIDDWQYQGMGSTGTVTRTLQPGTYTIQVDTFEGGGGHGVSLAMTQSSNVDDTMVDSAGNPNGSAANCNWAQLDSNDDANSLDFMWEEYGGGWDAFQQNTRCHLEFRGYVKVPGPADPSPMTRPEFVFWDVWDFGNSAQTGWLELAEYIPDAIVSGKADRSQMHWCRVDLHGGASANYNWTRHVVDLGNVTYSSGSSCVTNFIGKRLTFRYVMQNLNSTSRRRWYVDDIEIFDNKGRPEGDFLPGTFLNLNDEGAEEDFITSGQWELTSNNARPDFDNYDTNPEGCCSWELLPEQTYSEFSRADYVNGNDFTRSLMRIHTVELNGWVDINSIYPDDDGDTGDPFLEFYSAYYVGRRTGLEVQYTTDPFNVAEANWQPLPGTSPGSPAGVLRQVEYTSDSGGDQRSLAPVQIPLQPLVDSGITRFRLRFALLVHDDANRPWGSSGWWIDDIYLNREGFQRYVDYPFVDSAEITMDNWITTGQWWRTNLESREGEHAFTDSPLGEYERNTDTVLEFRYPVDFLNDSPANLLWTDRNPAGGNTFNAAAIDPFMSFWHMRELNRYDSLVVEWKKLNDAADDWNMLWRYAYGQNTLPSDNNSDSRENKVWEYVELDLTSILSTFTTATNPGDKEDDDILFRFRLSADSNYNVDNGVFIDEIRINEYQERTFKLWPTGENRTVGGTSFGNGNGLRFGNDGDAPTWFLDWRLGGGWEQINWEQQNGLYAFHESVGSQTVATPREDDATEQATYNDSFSVLELTTIIDLRATQAEEKPTLYFWTRYHVDSNNIASVQISEELPGTTADLNLNIDSRCGNVGLPQCYEQIYGWSPWLTTSNRSDWPWNAAGRVYNHLWTREQVDLSRWASQNDTTPGKRIRIRFVMNAMDTTNDTDGWYIDNVLIGPREDNVKRTIADTNFTDNSRNLNNWVAEGDWGLSPELGRGDGTGPATLGSWQESWWDCRDCESLAPSGTSSSLRYSKGTDAFLDSNGTLLPAYQTPVTRQVLDINYDMRGGAPRPGVFDRTDRFVGRWVLNTPVIGLSSGVAPGEYTFITVTDDGIRMKLDEVLSDGSLAPRDRNPDSDEWNVIYNWTDHGRTADLGNVTLEEGKRYRLTVEYYEKSGDATMIMTTGGASFSFTDRPKQFAGQSPDLGAWPNSRSSLILNGTLDLAGTTHPIIQYYTLYETHGTLRVEVSTDGGFTWTEDELQDGYAQDFVRTNFNHTGNNGTIAWNLSGSAVVCEKNVFVDLDGRVTGLGSTTFNSDDYWIYYRAYNQPDGAGTVLTNWQYVTGQKQSNTILDFNLNDYDGFLNSGYVVVGGEVGSVEVRLTPKNSSGTIRFRFYINDVQDGCAIEQFSDPSFGGDWHRPARDWREMRHNLTAYVGQKIMIRFQYDNYWRDNFDEDRYSGNTYLNGWWITDITVGS